MSASKFPDRQGEEARALERARDLPSIRTASDVDALRRAFADHLHTPRARTSTPPPRSTATWRSPYAVRDRLVRRWMQTQQTYYRQRRQAGLLPVAGVPDGPGAGQHPASTSGSTTTATAALGELGHRPGGPRRGRSTTPGLGNGGLGRLAACFLDSHGHAGLPGVRLRHPLRVRHLLPGDPRTAARSSARQLAALRQPLGDRAARVHRARCSSTAAPSACDGSGGCRAALGATPQTVMGMAYDTPIPGYRNDTVNTLRLWAAQARREEFDLDYFNHGDYVPAVRGEGPLGEHLQGALPERQRVRGPGAAPASRSTSSWPASLQDIIRRYRKDHRRLRRLPRQGGHPAQRHPPGHRHRRS